MVLERLAAIKELREEMRRIENETPSGVACSANLERAGFGDRVEVRVGPAPQTLAQLAAEEAGPFDLVFIDADKQHNPEYLDWPVRLSAATAR